MKYLLPILLLLPFPALALRVDNCDDRPHKVIIRYSGAEQVVELPPGKGRFVAGIPLELQLGDKVRDMINYDDEWCVWGENNLRIQRRHSQRRG